MPVSRRFLKVKNSETIPSLDNWITDGLRPLVGQRRGSQWSPVSKDLLMRKLINRLRRNDEGAALVEYGMLVGLIAVICVAAVTLLGSEVSTAFSLIAASLAAI